MMTRKYYFSSESVTDGHPDKVCDQIADAILDEALRRNKHAKMAVEATVKDDIVVVYGEQNLYAKLDLKNLPKDFDPTIDFASIAKKVLKDIGYDHEFKVFVLVGSQSKDIFDKVVLGDETAAGDQGIMFGYACNDTPNYMPLAIDTAHRLSKRLSDFKHEDSRIKPDGKTQVTVLYENDKPIRITKVVVSTQHAKELELPELRALIRKEVIDKVIDPKWIDLNDFETIINPGGNFIIGGPEGDSGTTGRKIVVDTYGGMGRIGGGCFSSKDPSKVDRSAAYYCRYVAKSVVANGLAERCEVQVSYAIGLKEPLSVYINTFGTEKQPIETIEKIVARNFDFTVGNIIEELNLLRPIYRKTSNFGHFGRIDADFSWENIKTLK
jgi:S-adenosylmethionine synthetase